MREYTICRVIDAIDWSSVPSLAIDNNLWLPEAPISATAQICYSDAALHVRLSAKEQISVQRKQAPLENPVMTAVWNSSSLL